jgi:TetR/AcrR family transcriptional regulator, transcriptional repressor for nem operon
VGSELVGVRQFDEDAALSSALEVFWRQGLAGTSMPDLARATGVQRGSLYNAYGDKETIFLRAFDLYATRLLAATEASLEGEDAGSMLDRFFETAIASMTCGLPPRGCLTTKTATDGSIASEQIRLKLQDRLNRFAALIEAALNRPAVRRQLALEPADAASVVVTFTRGLAVMERVYSNRKALLRAAGALTRALVVDPAEGSAARRRPAEATATAASPRPSTRSRSRP